MTEVFKNLWLGNINDSLDLNFILKNNINCVINCTINQPFLQYKEIKYKYRIPIKDNLQNEEFYLLYLLLNKTIDIIIKHLLLNDRILISNQRYFICQFFIILSSTQYDDYTLDRSC